MLRTPLGTVIVAVAVLNLSSSQLAAFLPIAIPGCPITGPLCVPGILEAPTVCACDDHCIVFGDCCPDVLDVGVPPGVQDVPEVLGCVPVAGSAFYGVASCRAESEFSELCGVHKSGYEHLQVLPVYSTGTSRLYSNYFCAACHNDTNDLLVWAAQYTCSSSNVTLQDARDVIYNVTHNIYVVRDNGDEVSCLLRILPTSLPQGLRQCLRVHSACAPDWPANDDAQRLCRIYSFPVVDASTEVIFKNAHCAHCNHVALESLHCDLPTDTVAPPPEPRHWAEITLNFNVRQQLNECDVYDPIFQRCMTVEPGVHKSWSVPRNACHADEMILDPKDVKFVGNTSIIVDGDVVHDFREVKIGNEWKIWACVPERPGELDFSASPSDTASILSYVSLICLILHLLSYSILSHLRTRQGKALLLVSVGLIFEQIAMIAGKAETPDTVPCAAAAVCSHYFILVSASASDVLAFDVYHAFSNSQLHARATWLLARYAAYAYLCPLVPVLVGIVLHTQLWYKDLSPEYGENHPCWLSERGGVLAFLIIPWAVAVGLATLILVETVRRVGSASSVEKKTQKWSDRARLRRYIGFVIVSGVACTLGLLAVSGPFPKLWQPFAVSLALRGIYVFGAFTCSDRRFLSAVREKLRQRRSDVLRDDDANVNTTSHSSSIKS
ncbi:uncharacterized protein LOC135392015 isoform X2 [Ornithodoros turicata]|uniref:uncharacterized protein LOC135392015 isoform X2 n=1 Tax=Ornithodoros turicata TaxID=34597 RepID=UPI003139B908